MLEMHLNVEKKKGRIGYFIEELSNAQFTTYANVASLTGITQGTLHNEGTGWLRFDYEGTELIVSKKTIRYGISWSELARMGCVGGDRVITILGNQYKIRLLKGADTNPYVDLVGDYLEGTHNSEWSRLFYPLVSDDQYLNDQYTGPKYPTYTNLELGMITTENGCYSWCQETHKYGSKYRVVRGGSGVSHLYRFTYTGTVYTFGWRPVLELVP